MCGYISLCDLVVSFVSSTADLGRFEQNFSIGFQLRTLVQTGLIFYLFSRRVDDAFAVQLINGTVSTILNLTILYIQRFALTLAALTLC